MHRYLFLAALMISAAAAGCGIKPQPPQQLPAITLRPGQAVLFEAIERANRIQVVDAYPPHGRMLFESALPPDRAALKEALSGFEEDPNLFWPGIGDPIIRLYADSEIVGEIGYSGAQTVLLVEVAKPGNKKLLLMSDKEGEKVNEDPDSFNKALHSKRLREWFLNRGVTAPKEQYDRFLTAQKADLEDERRYVEAMPRSLVPFWTEMKRPRGVIFPAPCERPDISKMSEVLKEEIPAEKERILALYEWLGSKESDGSSPWCGRYEDFPGWLLLEHRSNDLIRAASLKDLSPQQARGALRFFGSDIFVTSRPADAKRIPRAVAAQIKEANKAIEHAPATKAAVPAAPPAGEPCWDFYTHLEASCDAGVTDAEFQNYRATCIEGGAMNCSLVLTRAEFEQRKKAASAGDAQAAVDLAGHFSMGIEVERLALPWMRRAGELGRKDQQVLYGEALLKSAESAQEQRDALRLIESAALEGETLGAVVLTRTFARGTSAVRRDRSRAKCWKETEERLVAAEDQGGQVEISCPPAFTERQKKTTMVYVPKREIAADVRDEGSAGEQITQAQ